MKKPNVLILFSDQQRYDTICSVGYTHMHTPNLDKLASEGHLFCNAHSGNPVCMPARHDLITGFPARVHGYYANGESQRIKDYSVPTIGRIFSDNDYRTVSVGKMHFSPAREHHGFSQMLAMEELPKIRQNDEYLMYLKDNDLGHIQNPHGVRPHIYHIPQTSQQPNEFHGSAWVADTAIDWIDKNENNPFFMMCGFIQPHPPWNIPKEWQDLYADVDVPKSIEQSRLPFEDNERKAWYCDDDSEEEKAKIRKAYYTAVSMVDFHVGRVIEHLREIGELDNTLIIYSSDHGEMLQDKGYYSKELPYDSAVRVPLIVRYPKAFSGGVKRDEFVDLLDVLPTCLDICDIKYPKDVELYGKSIKDIHNREYQYAATGKDHHRWVMCRNKEYKYIYHFNGGYEELYDTTKDEVTNLLVGNVSDSIKEIYDDLKKHAIAYEEKWGIVGFTKNGDFVAKEESVIHASVRSKFHLWSNNQMQKYYEADKYNRAKELEDEMKYALSNQEFSGIKLENVFNDEEWKKDFSERFNEYTNGDDFNKFPFKK